MTVILGSEKFCEAGTRAAPTLRAAVPSPSTPLVFTCEPPRQVSGGAKSCDEEHARKNGPAAKHPKQIMEVEHRKQSEQDECGNASNLVENRLQKGRQ